MQKLLIAPLFIVFIFATEKTFIDEYSYPASENDSKVTARANALEKVTMLLLEQVYEFFINEVDWTKEKIFIKGKSINKDIYKQTIKSIVDGMIEINVIYQKWNTKTYSLKGKVSLDTEDIRVRINKIIDKQKKFVDSDFIITETNSDIDNLIISISPDNISPSLESNESDTSLTPNFKFVAYDIPPKSIIPIQPIYPDREKKAGIEGIIHIQFFIDDTGNVTEASVIQGIPNTGLNKSALSAVKKSRWEPALQGKKKVGVWQTIPVKFELKSN